MTSFRKLIRLNNRLAYKPLIIFYTIFGNFAIVFGNFLTFAPKILLHSVVNNSLGLFLASRERALGNNSDLGSNADK